MVSVMHQSRADLERAIETYRAKALAEHVEVRRWMQRALTAEQRLAELLEPPRGLDDPEQDEGDGA